MFFNDFIYMKYEYDRPEWCFTWNYNIHRCIKHHEQFTLKHMEKPSTIYVQSFRETLRRLSGWPGNDVANGLCNLANKQMKPSAQYLSSS